MDHRSKKSQVLFVVRISVAIAVAFLSLAGSTGDGEAHAQNLVVGTAAITPVPSKGQSVTQLPDGRWLFAGGVLDGAPSAQILLTSSPDPIDATRQVFPATLAYARSGHSATVLPDGRILVLGGEGLDELLVPQAEIIDLQAGTVTVANGAGFVARTEHSAVLLTNGQVLIAGGLAEGGNALDVAQLWDPGTGAFTSTATSMLSARYDHVAALLSTGDVLISGGKSTSDGGWDEIYNVATNSFERASASGATSGPHRSASPGEPPAVAASLPTADAVDVPVNALISIRFNKPIPVAQINSSTVTVVGPTGAVDGHVVGAEGGRLAFFKASTDLTPGATFTVFVSRITDAGGAPLPLSSIRFSTHQFRLGSASKIPNTAPSAINPSASSKASTPSVLTSAQVAANSVKQTVTKPLATPPPAPEEDGSEDWTPSEQNRHGQWRVLGLANDPVMAVLPQVTSKISVAVGQTAVSGQILRYNGKPLIGAAVSIGPQSTVTDGTGRFVLTGVPSGSSDLKVDGTGVIVNGHHYTKHFIQVKLPRGVTTPLADPIFLPRVDPATEVSISSPATTDMVLTHPAIPGLEVHIPKGVVLREYDGKIVTRLSITPIPVDRPPYPTPVPFSVYFTLQPGGAYVDGDPSKSIKVIYPNYQGLSPGTRANFWNYDPSVGWKVYGQGVVSKDGKQVVPESGVGFRQIMGFGLAIGTSDSPAATGPPAGGCTRKADPVDCATGLFLHSVTDLTIRDVIPISVNRTYRQNDNVSRAFGIGTNLSYAMSLYTGSTASAPPEVDLVLSDGGRVHYLLQSGNSFVNGIWTNTDSPTAFQGSTLTADPASNGFKITLRDMTVLRFAHEPPNGLLSITDRNGNALTLTVVGVLTGTTITQITSPNGRYVQFTYDNSGRITKATDNAGRTVGYAYDTSGRLQTVTDANGKTESYTYDTSNRMLTVTDRRNNLMVTNHYDANGRVSQQDLPDGSWLFSYTLDGNGNVTQTTITDPRNIVENDTFNAAGYLTQDVLAVGQPEQQTFTYQRDATNLVQLITDPLGRQTKYTYDTFGDVLSVTQLYGTASAVSGTFTYDPTFRQLASFTDPLSHTTNIAYDTHGNLHTITDPLGHQVTVTENSQGLPTVVQDALAHQTQIGYLQADVSSVTDALGRTTQAFTDGLGRIQSATDPLGNVTQYAYDPLDRPTQVTDAAGGITAVVYDANGNVQTVTDPRNLGTHAYTYDTRNRVQTYTGPVGGTETYNYDGMSNLINKTDRKSQLTQYAYDALNRLHVITYADASTLTITWDAGNRPTDFVDSLNGTIHRDYDGLDRVTVERGPQGEIDYFYDAAGRRDHIIIAGQSQPITYQFDNANRLTQVAQGSATLGFGYDAANRRTGVTLPNGIIGTLGFDNANQLTSISYDGTVHVADATYGYDAAGRRTSASGSLVRPIADSTLSAATYDAGNHLTAVGTNALSYDANGNLTTASGPMTNTLTWNARDQLIGTGNGTTLAYDALGRLVGRTSGGATSSYIYDGLSQLVANGSVTLRGSGPDEVYAQITSGSTVSYLTDALGSVAMLATSTQAITTQYSYGAYGAIASTGASGPATTVTPFEYTGAEFNPTDQLQYLRNRYYSPQLQRFVSEDPIGLGGGVNTYAYAEGNPVSLIDPFGLLPGDPYNSPGAAASDALNYINQWSIITNTEYAGLVYYNPADDQYYATPPIPTGEHGGTSALKYPTGKKPVGDYHTHANYVSENLCLTTKPHDIANSDHFSTDDLQWKPPYLPWTRYLGTPSGNYLQLIEGGWFSHSTGIKF